jgi:hypothetical protein
LNLFDTETNKGRAQLKPFGCFSSVFLVIIWVMSYAIIFVAPFPPVGKLGKDEKGWAAKLENSGA